MNKPEYISYKDWELLTSKYSSLQLEEYFNKNYPYQYLIGNVDFCNLEIIVDERALIPRFETELLVIETIKLIKQLNFVQPNVIDLCTGTGCIAIALKKNIECNVTAVDISKDTIDLAKENALKNNVNINFVCDDIINDKNNYDYDIVISNPPYIDINEIVGLSTKYEPQIALFADENGLIFYKHILQKYYAKLYAFEIGCTQKFEVINIIKNNYPQAKIIAKKDYAGLDRYIFAINE